MKTKLIRIFLYSFVCSSILTGNLAAEIIRGKISLLNDDLAKNELHIQLIDTSFPDNKINCDMLVMKADYKGMSNEALTGADLILFNAYSAKVPVNLEVDLDRATGNCYVSSIKVEENINVSDLRVKGKVLFRHGKNLLPGCIQCHGESAEGNTQLGAPALVNMSRGKFLQTMQDYRLDRRIDKKMQVMNMNVKFLENEDIFPIWLYISSLKQQ